MSHVRKIQVAVQVGPDIPSFYFKKKWCTTPEAAAKTWAKAVDYLMYYRKVKGHETITASAKSNVYPRAYRRCLPIFKKMFEAAEKALAAGSV